MRQKIRVDSSEVLREGADDLTQRAEEVGTLKACINVNHIDEKVGRPPLVDADAYQFMKELKEKNGKSCIFIAEIWVRRQGPKKPNESQKAKALWAMKAAKDRGAKKPDVGQRRL